MKIFFLFFFLAASQAFSVHKEWEEFKKSFGKEYKDVKEELHRIKIFFENKLLIEEHNKNFEKGLVSFKMRMNHFGDWLHEEFRSNMNRFNSSKTPRRDSSCDDQCEIFRSTNDAPDSIDWRSKGAVTPVKNQRNCGSCWAFSTTGALEGQNFRKTGKLVSLSEQNLIDCSLKFGNHGCGGGLMDNAFRYIKENGGIDTEDSYPYAGVNEPCRFNPSHVGATDSGFVDIPRGDENALKNAVATVGPVSVGIDAGRRSFQFYHSGVYSEKHCSSFDLDHGVLVVGYGTENGKDYWLVKNSWSTEWGDEGYIKMSRNNKNNCGIATAASYPII